MSESPKQSVTERLTQKLKAGANHTMQYVAEVATGKKLMEGLSKNDGALDGWLAHGSTELANMMLHGHPAPVYARSLSPADTEGAPAVEPQLEAVPQNEPQSKENQVGVHGPEQGHAPSQFQSSLKQLCEVGNVPKVSPEISRQPSR